MARDVTKVLKYILAKVEIGSVAEGSSTDPGTYYEVGTITEDAVKIKLPAVMDTEAGGQQIQKAFEASFEVSGLELTNTAISTNIPALVNTNVWIKVTPLGTPNTTDKPIVRIKNVLLNMEYDLDLSAKGKSVAKFTGKKYVSALTDLVSMASS